MACQGWQASWNLESLAFGSTDHAEWIHICAWTLTWLFPPPQFALRAPLQNQGADSSADPGPAPGSAVAPKHKAEEIQAPQLQSPQQPQPPALCRALFDFNPEKLNLEDSKCCLSFLKVWLKLLTSLLKAESLSLFIFRNTCCAFYPEIN